MPTAYARTDGTGHLLTPITANRPLTKEEMYGERIDPWLYVSRVSPGKGRHFHEFFVEDKYGDLVFRELDKYTHVLLTGLNKLKYTTTTFYSAVEKYIEDRR
jgi:hypothetical protein